MFKPDIELTADERALRRLLCAAREKQAYMDDGEASSADGLLDYMRMDLAELEDAFIRRNMKNFAEKTRQLEEVGIEFSLDHPFNPVHELDGVLADLKAGKPFDDICKTTVERVRNYFAIMYPQYYAKG